jgi:hypothetical protein
MKTMNQILGTILLVTLFATSVLANKDSLPTNNTLERNQISSQIKNIVSAELKTSSSVNTPQNIIVKVMVDENGKAYEVKVFCDNAEIKEKVENKFKSLQFKDFQDYTYYYFKVTINKV